MTDTVPTHYAVLGVEPDATEEAIRKAFNKAAKHLHPDRNGGVELPYYRLAAEARDVLLDAERRAAYDASLSAPSPAAEPEPEAWGEEEYVDVTVDERPAPAPQPPPKPVTIPKPLKVELPKDNSGLWTLLATPFFILAIVFLFWHHHELPLTWWTRVPLAIVIGVIIYSRGAEARRVRFLYGRWVRMNAIARNGGGVLLLAEVASREQMRGLAVNPDTLERVDFFRPIPPTKNSWILQEDHKKPYEWIYLTHKEWSTAMAVEKRMRR